MPTKIADVTVGADGAWSSGPHTLASGARSVTLRRKSDGAVLATRSFTVGSSAVAVSDNFNRATGGLGSNWATVNGTPAIQSSTSATTSGTANSAARWVASFAADQYAECVAHSSAVLNGYGNGPAVRMSSSANTFYFVGVDSYDDGEGGGNDYIKLYKCVAGTKTQIGSTYSAGISELAAVVVRLEVSGTSLTVKTSTTHGGTFTTRITATDSAISSGSAGFFVASTQDYIDNWYGGDL